MVFRVYKRRRTLPSFGFKKWHPLTTQVCDTQEQAQRWIAELKRCDRNFGHFTEYRIKEIF